jgi:hypothetical protein
LVLAACGGGEGERTASVIHRLLLAAGAEGSGELESFAGELPEGLPATPPRYPGAELIVSSRQPAALTDPQATPEPGAQGVPQPMLYFIVFDTSAGREEVFSYYEAALEKDPWQLDSSFSTRDLDTLEFSNVDDLDISGVVSIAGGGEDGRTSILISLQDAGAFLEEAPPYEPGESLPRPKEFPTDMPVYRGAIVTGSAFFREPGNESFLLIFVTPAGQDEVIEFYRSEFQRRDWIVQSGAPFGLEERIDFRDGRGDVRGEVLADRFARDRRYTEVRLQVQVNPAREPVELDEDETPAPTEEREATPAPTAARE